MILTMEYEVNGIVYTSGQIPVNPADGSVAVKDLPKGVLCEIEAIAVKP